MAMQTVTQKFRQAKVSELIPHPDNPRQGDVGAIHTSIEANGFYGAIIVQKSTQHVLVGNHRLMAAAQSGATTVPVIEVDVDDRTAKRILLADNRTNDLASYDTQALTDLLKSLAVDDELLGTGYDGDDLDDLLQAWASDMKGVLESPGSGSGSSLGKFIVTFDETQRDDIRARLTSALEGVDGVTVA